MNLSDLLSELRDNILYDRSDSVAGDPDQLWSDATLVRYINEAHRRFAARALVIRDASTPEVVNVTLEEGVTSYDLHPSVIAVISARQVGVSADLIRVGHSVLGSITSPSSDVWDLSQVASMPPGAPLAYTTDEEVVDDDDGSISVVSMRIWPEPDASAAGETIKLRVVRTPLDEFTEGNLSATPEIPVNHHIEMLDWAAYLALRLNDIDAGSMTRAEKFAASFESHVAEARKMVMRKLFAPKPWSFGRGGWSWGG